MKLLKTKIAILSSVFLLSSFELNASDVAAPKNPAETKYQTLLGAGSYDDLTDFLKQMVKRMTAQLDAARKAEAALKEDDLADEMELETAHSDTINKQFALKFWQDRLDAVDSLRGAAEADKKRIQQINDVLPKVVELTKRAIEEKHESNAAFGDLARYVKDNGDFLKTVEGVGETVPEITLDMGVKQAIQDGKIAKFQKAIEAYLLKLEQEAKAREAEGKDKATSVERDSNSKRKKRGDSPVKAADGKDATADAESY
jgi:hypothetical protein